MHKYLKIYNKAFEEGMIQAFDDINNNKIKDFKSINDNDLKSKIYDIGYIKGYKKLYYKIKNSLLFDKKI